MANIALLWKSTATPLAGVGRVRAIPPPRTPSILRFTTPVISTPSSLNLSWRCLKISAQAIPLPLQIQPQPNPKPTIYEIFKALKKSATVLFLIAGLLLSNPICAPPYAAASLSVSEEVLPQTDETTKKDCQTQQTQKLTLAEKMFLFSLLPTLICLLYLLHLLTKHNHFVVGKVQLAFLGTATSVQTDLNQYNDVAAMYGDALSAADQRSLFHVVIHTLLRHKDHCISIHSSGCVEKSFGAASRKFDELKIKGKAKSSKEPTNNDGLNNEYIVVTILLIIEGYQKMPTIDRSQALESALGTFEFIPLSKILGLGVELNPPLSEKDFHEQYPLLKPRSLSTGRT